MLDLQHPGMRIINNHRADFVCGSVGAEISAFMFARVGSLRSFGRWDLSVHSEYVEPLISRALES